MSSLRRQCQINENILRVLFLRVDPRIIDALVAHAKGETAAPSTPPAPEQPGRGRPKRGIPDVPIDPEEFDGAEAAIADGT